MTANCIEHIKKDDHFLTTYIANDLHVATVGGLQDLRQKKTILGS